MKRNYFSQNIFNISRVFLLQSLIKSDVVPVGGREFLNKKTYFEMKRERSIETIMKHFT